MKRRFSPKASTARDSLRLGYELLTLGSAEERCTERVRASERVLPSIVAGERVGAGRAWEDAEE